VEVSVLVRAWSLSLLVACAPPADEAPDPSPATSGPTDEGSPTIVDSGPTADTGLSEPSTDPGTEPPAEWADPDVATFVPPDYQPDEVRRVVFFGDSITAGEGVFHPRGHYASLLVDNDDANWPDHADHDLVARWPDVEVIDVSRSGATTVDVLQRQIPELEALLEPELPGTTLVVGTVGGNDIGTLLLNIGDVDAEVERISGNVAEIASWFQASDRFAEQPFVYVTNIYEPTDDMGQADECFYGLPVSFLRDPLTDLNQATRDAAMRDGWAWIDLYGHFQGHGLNHDDPTGPNHDAADPTLWLSTDCVHPNARGHHEIRRLFYYAIAAEPLPVDDLRRGTGM
jgi:lysophospholipase L1-like esterase